MSAIYLIDTTKTLIVGRFDSAEDAALAGELHMAGDYYVGGSDDLKGWKREELRRMLEGLGVTTAANRDKAWFLAQIEHAAANFEFAPLVKEEPKGEAKAATSNGANWPKEGTVCRQVWDLAQEHQNRAAVLKAAAEAGINPATASTQWQRWSKRAQ